MKAEGLFDIVYRVLFRLVLIVLLLLYFTRCKSGYVRQVDRHFDRAEESLSVLEMIAETEKRQDIKSLTQSIRRELQDARPLVEEMNTELQKQQGRAERYLIFSAGAGVVCGLLFLIALKR